MNGKLALGIISLIFGLLALPFGLYLTYLTLIRIEATELMWFIFWLYVPLIIIFQIVSKIFDSMKEEN